MNSVQQTPNDVLAFWFEEIESIFYCLKFRFSQFRPIPE